MSIHEIVLPETKPETEWVLGRPLQKVSPTYSHARLQSLLATAFTIWAEDADCGRVGTEWRFRVGPPGEIVRPLVPDVAFVSYAALPADAAAEAFEVPLGAPTVAVEVLSPDDRPPAVEHKTRVYLAAGTAAVVIVDPATSSIRLRDANGERCFVAGDMLALESMPGFALDVARLFARAKR